MSKPREGITKAKESVDKLKASLDTINEYKDSFKEAAKTLKKLASAAKALGAAAVILDIGLGFFPQEDQKEKMLKEIIGLMGDLKNQISSLSSDMTAGFDKVYKDSEYRSAKTQISDSVTYINTFLEELNELNKIDPDAPEFRNDPETLRWRVKSSKERLLEFDYDDLAKARNTIRAACTSDGYLRVNILKAAMESSNADMVYLQTIGKRLISLATSANLCIRIYLDLKEEEKFEKEQERYRDDKNLRADEATDLEYLDQRLKEKKEEKLRMQMANVTAQNKIFTRMISEIEEAIEKQEQETRKFSTVVKDNNVKHGVQKALDRTRSVDAQGLFNKLSSMWPGVKLMVMMTENKSLRCWNNLENAYLKAGRTSPVSVVEEVVSSNKAFKAMVIVLDPDWKIPKNHQWKINDEKLKSYFYAYMQYVYNNTLHKYANDHGNTIGHYPFAFFSVGTLNMGVVTSPGMIKADYVIGSTGYKLVVPNWS